MKSIGIKNMSIVAVMTALLCIIGPVSLPVGPVPVSLTPLGVFLAVYVLGMKRGTMAYIIYLLIGLAGLPVLSGAAGGPAKVFGPTGGYLFGFIFMAAVSGFFIEKFEKNPVMHFIGMFSGLLICYALGTLWLDYSVAKMNFQSALAAGVLPFIFFDIIKIITAIIAGRAVRGRLLRAGVI